MLCCTFVLQTPPPALSALAVTSVVFACISDSTRCYEHCCALSWLEFVHKYHPFRTSCFPTVSRLHQGSFSFSASSSFPLSAGPGKMGSLCLFPFLLGTVFWLTFACLVIWGCVLHVVTGMVWGFGVLLCSLAEHSFLFCFIERLTELDSECKHCLLCVKSLCC